MKVAQGFSAAIAGVLYAEDFDEPLLERPAAPGVPQPEPEPETIVPSFSLEELRSATERAHEEGRRAEREMLMGSLESGRLAALGALAEELHRTRHQVAQVTEEALEQLSTTVLTVVAAALPGLCAQYGAAEIGLLLRRILPPLRRNAELQIRLHPSVRTAVERTVAEMLDDADTTVTWSESDALAPGDVTVRWSSGEAVRDTRDLCTQIRTALSSLFPDPVTQNLIGLSAETPDVERA